MRVFTRSKFAGVLISLIAFSALAEGGGGEGGGGPGAPGAAPPAPGRAAGPGRAPAPDGTSTLPGGSTITLSGPPGNREVTVTTPDGKKYSGTHIRTTRNAQTGITSVWIRNADGSRTGVHTDRQGNQSVTNHKR